MGPAFYENAMPLGMSAEMQNPSGALSLYRDAFQYGLPDDYGNGYAQRIEALTPSRSMWRRAGCTARTH